MEKIEFRAIIKFFIQEGKTTDCPRDETWISSQKKIFEQKNLDEEVNPISKNFESKDKNYFYRKIKITFLIVYIKVKGEYIKEEK